MAIYHFSAKVIGRSQGRSAVAAAAYRAAERLHDEKLGRDHDYTAKTGVVHSEILLPDGAPERWQDRSTLWNEVEAGEKRKDAQLARDIEISLPRELGKTEAIRLAQDFVREQFVARGMVADLNVHWARAGDGEAQPHAHVMLTLREVVPGREGPSQEAGFGRKEVAWNDRELLCEWRERWAGLANERLCALGYDIRIDHRSYREQGIALEPQHKIGPAGARREERGEEAERAAEHRAIAQRNGERLLAEPEIALKALTHQHSTFTRQDLARFVDRHTDGREQFAAVLARVEAAPELVRVGEDERGRERLTTRTMLETEHRLERVSAEIAGHDRHLVSPAAGERALRMVERDGLVLGEEQRDAFRHITSGPDLALVVGYAGTGKSALLGVARTAWEREGYTVRGLALSGIAAQGLEAGSGIASRTIASLEYAWARGEDRLGGRDVLVVDEAGMVGSRQMERVLSQAQEAGAKVVLIGDPEQLQAIEAGAAFRALFERHGAAEITEVRRQREDWQREATRDLATGRTEKALERYEAAGMVQEGAGTRAEASAALVAGWEAAREAHPEKSRIILAYTRADVAELNRLARERMREAGVLRGADRVVETERGERAFAEGDRVLFLRNERGLGGEVGGRAGVAVKNGTLGTVLAVAERGERLSVRLDGAGPERGRTVTFDTRDYAHIEHGYAATVHKAQGITVDRAHVLATPHLDRHAAYVGLTRHREGVALHYAREDFPDRERLAHVLGRERAKDTTLDYERESDLVRRYAERRGLVPESAIRLPERTVEKMRQGRFAGLRLEMPREGPGLVREIAAPGEREDPQARQQERERDLTAYARAWSDAARMAPQNLPVLPHQEIALERAGQRLEAHEAGLSRDVRAALERGPGLAHGLGQPEGRAALDRVIGMARAERLLLERTGREVVKAWDRLERAFDRAERAYDWSRQHDLGKRLEGLAREVKADRHLDELLRTRGQEFGIAGGSLLARVVRGQKADLTRELRYELGLDRGYDLGWER
ncbi:MAG: Ti-type conjugative transfer relaxase TraA [Acetobacteraceae bacterium]